jgi:ribosomal protein S18 acetylase RimI-like enzyme
MATTTHEGGARVLDGRAVEIATTRDRNLLRRFLEQDRLRAAYAICDLERREFARSKWGIAMSGGEPIAVVLEYGGLTPQPLFVMGHGESVTAILRDLIRPRLVYLAADSSLIPYVEPVYRVDAGPQMLRMWVNREMFRPIPGPAGPLSPVDIVDLNRLYGLGFAGWLPSDSVGQGVYYGVRVNGRLIAAAGTHVISPEAKLAAVGNVMTHADFRRRGYAKVTTSAVTQELLRTCDEVVLNVRSDNPPAIAAYEALGYRVHCRFEERLAHRRGAPWDSILAQLGRLLVRNKEPA